MKKIVLGCAAVLLSLGLLAGCNNNPSTVDAVIISVDTSASVVVGETLELPYSVEPEKATVVAASDHEEYVTADAQDGILYLHGVTEGSAIVTLVGTYKKYAEANVNIDVSVVTEATEKTEPGTPDTGGGTGGSGTKEPVAGTVAEGEYWLGFTMSEVDYYFDGTVYNTNYAGVTSDGWDAVTVTVAEASGGYTLSFVDEEEVTQYLKLAVEDTSVRLRWSEDEEFVWIYDTTYGTFVAYSSDTPYFIGTYSSYKDLCLNDYGYLTGDKSTNYAQLPAKLYTPVTYTAPTADTLVISGGTEVYHNGRLYLTATAEEGEDPRVTWSVASGSETYASVTSTGSTTCTVFGNEVGSATIVATSVADPSVSVSIEITISATPDDLPFEIGEDYWLGFKHNSNTYYFDGGISYYTGTVSTKSADGVFVTIGQGETGYTLSFVDSENKQQYLYAYISGSYLNLGLQEDAFDWQYDFTNETFVVDVDETTLFLGNYYNSETYNEIRVLDLSVLSNPVDDTTYCVVAPIEAAEPTDITITGGEEVVVGRNLSLSATVANGEDHRFTWSITSGEDYASINSETGVLTAGETEDQEIVVRATSLKHPSVYEEATITTIAEPTGTETLLGTIDMTKNTANETDANKTTAASLQACWDGTDSSDLVSVSNVDKVYLGANSNTNDGNTKVLQFGSSSATGTITLTFSQSITKVEAYGAGYVDSGARGLTVNNESQSFSSYISAGNIGNDTSWTSYAQTLTYTLASPTTSITLANTGNRVVLRTISVYYLA